MGKCKNKKVKRKRLDMLKQFEGYIDLVFSFIEKGKINYTVSLCINECEVTIRTVLKGKKLERFILRANVQDMNDVTMKKVCVMLKKPYKRYGDGYYCTKYMDLIN